MTNENIPLQYISNINVNNINSVQPFSIESGFFIFTLMPSLRCSLNCPHCYLSLEQRRDSKIMDLDELISAAKKVDNYYQKKQIKNKVIVFYWYGGEPTEMGIDYMESAVDSLNNIFSKDKGYSVKHTVLTSLITVDTKIWFPFFKKYTDNHFQSSFDGLMRGMNYVKKWESKIKEAVSQGLEVGTISVVNNELLKSGATKIMSYLTDLGVKEVSFLPFMLNEQNISSSYDKYAPSMDKWSEFMIEASEFYFSKKSKNEFVPEIGQLSFALHQFKQPSMANIAGQTLFLLPNGDFVLPDYTNGYKEYMRVFGNIQEQSFEEVLQSTERRSYLRKQVLRDNNPECIDCQYSNACVMEFWKQNKSNDDCFGGKKYIDWLFKNATIQTITTDTNVPY